MKTSFRAVALLILFCLAPPSMAQGEQRENPILVDGVSYIVKYGSLVVAGYPKDADVITVQTAIDGVQVMSGGWSGQEDMVTAKTLIFAEGGDTAPSMDLSLWPNLERIVLPASVTDIEYLFRGRVCGNLCALEVHPDNPAFQSMDGVLFSRDGRKLLAFPPGLTDAYAIPETVTEIAEGAFPACDEPRLARLILPDSLTKVDVRCLPDYHSLKALEVAVDHPCYESREGMLCEKKTGTLLYVPPGQGEYLHVPNGIRGIASDAFRFSGENEWARSVSMPLSLVEMAPYAFAGCTALMSIALPPRLHDIPEGAFKECLALERVVLPMALETIGPLAFNGCAKLREVYIPNSVRYINPTAFDYANESMVIYAPEGSEGHAFAKAQGLYWAEPGGAPIRLERQRRPAAVINLPETGAQASLLMSPSESAPAVAQYPNGTLVELLEREGAWQRVRVGSVSGYVRGDILQHTDALTNLITFSFAELYPDPWDDEKSDWDNEWPFTYTYPGTDAPRVLSYDNPQVEVLFAVGPWIYVKCSRQNYGYMPINRCDIYRRDTGDGKRYGIVLNDSLSNRLHLREAADKSSASLGRYFTGTQFEILGETGNWMHVRLDGKVGYFLKDYVQEVLVGTPYWEDWSNPNG